MPANSPRPDHWDLMFESEGRLLTWAVDELPVAGAALIGQPLADHRIDYLNYEGPISGDRGSVTRISGGTFRRVDQSSQATGVNQLVVELAVKIDESDDLADLDPHAMVIAGRLRFGPVQTGNVLIECF